MRTLLWKDYRENRKILMAIAVFILTPYVGSIVMGIAELSVNRVPGWVQLLRAGSAIALFLSAGVTSFIAGNAIAGERANRSAEFAAYLPIPRQSAIMSKAIVAISICLCMLVVNFGINQLASWVEPNRIHDLRVQDVVLRGLPAVVLMFGVAWLFSSFSRSPVIAAASGLAAFLVQMGALIYSTSDTGGITDTWLHWYWSTSLLAGGGGFAVGVVCHLRRVEP
ncbi:MAG: hypothetical protein QUV05_06470 [Phycisphaerae bacterium]|nr:hypothetical protein [Phycisphaerae bacterium]